MYFWLIGPLPVVCTPGGPFLWRSFCHAPYVFPGSSLLRCSLLLIFHPVIVAVLGAATSYERLARGGLLGDFCSSCSARRASIAVTLPL
jgi:hypothetical protein